MIRRHAAAAGSRALVGLARLDDAHLARDGAHAHSTGAGSRELVRHAGKRLRIGNGHVGRHAVDGGFLPVGRGDWCCDGSVESGCGGDVELAEPRRCMLERDVWLR